MKCAAKRPPRQVCGQTPQCEEGQRFGKLTAMARYKRSQSGARWWWVFKCDCGNEVVRQIARIRNRPEVGCYDCLADIRPLTDEERNLVADHFLIAKKMVAHFQSSWGKWAKWNDSIESAGMYGLMVAAMQYPSDSQESFRNFAFTKIKNQIRREVLRTFRPLIEMPDVVDQQPVIARVHDKLLAEEHYARMTDEEAEIVRLYYQGFSLDDIKVLVNGSFGTVRRRYLSGMSKAKGEPQPEKMKTRVPVVVPGVAKPKSLNAEQQRLAADYIPMARAMSKPYKIAYPRFNEEFESSALLALVDAARSYDETRGIKFATFSRFRISGALKDTLRVVSRWEQNSEEVVESVLDKVGPPPDGGLEWIIRRLPENHRRVCFLHYKEGKTQQEIAVLMGYSQSRVSALHRESLEMFQAEKSMLMGELEDRRLGKSLQKTYRRCRICGSSNVQKSPVTNICHECIKLGSCGLN
jgi:RNA polymerase sigma factor (sigma-70 family)